MNCLKCESPIPAGTGTCDACGTTVVRAESMEQVEQISNESRVLTSFISKYKMAIAGAIGVIILALAVVLIIIPMSSQKSGSPVVFIANEKIFLHVENQKEPVELSTRLFEEEPDWDNGYYGYEELMNYSIKLNEEQNKLFFPKRINDDGTATIFYRDLNKKLSSWDEDQGVKLASGVSNVAGDFFTLSGDGQSVIYFKSYDYEEGGKLYLHDLSEEVAIDTGVNYYWYSDEKSVLYYTKMNDDDKDLYVVTINNQEDRKKVDSNVSGIAQFDELEGEIYYYKNDYEAEHNYMTLYSKTLTGEKTKILSGIADIASRIDNNSFYYTVYNKKQVALSSMVEDDMSAQDSNVIEPDISDYQTMVKEPYTDWYGDTQYSENINTDYDAYDAAYETYVSKADRERLRERMNEELYDYDSTTLYLFSENKSTKITDDYRYSPYSDINTQMIFYFKNEIKGMKRLLLSEVEDIYEVYDALENLVDSSDVTYVANHLNAGTPFLDEDVTMNYTAISQDSKQLYNIESTESMEELVVYDLKEGKLTNRKVLDEEVSGFTYVPELSRLYYYKDIRNGVGELYEMVDGKSKRIAMDVEMGLTRLYAAEDKLLYITDYSNNDRIGTLHEYSKNESKKISNDVGGYYYNGGSDVYLLADYSNERASGELTKASGKDETVSIYDRVNTMLETLHYYRF